MKDPNIKFYRHPYSGRQAAMCGQKNKHDKAERCISRLCEHAYKCI